MKIAAIDLGSNTFLCLIADVVAQRFENIYSDNTRIVRLGEGVGKTGRLSEEALARADLALSEFSTIIESEKPEKVYAVATAAARSASNKQDLINLCNKYSIPIQIIEGSYEARLSFHGALSGVSLPGHYFVIDIGGASTEVVYGTQQTLLFGKSLPVGVVKLTEAYFQEGDLLTNINKMEEDLSKILEENLGSLSGRHIDAVFAVAGTPTTLAAIELGGYSPERVDNFVFSRERIREWSSTFAALSPRQISEDYGVDPKRADVMLAGTILLAKILQVLQQESLLVSIRGLRYGVGLAIERGEF